jgi:hypothetical protein
VRTAATGALIPVETKPREVTFQGEYVLRRGAGQIGIFYA